MIHTTTDTLLAAVDRAAGKYIPTEREDRIAVRLNRLLARDGDGQIIAAPGKDRGTGDARGLIVIEPVGGGKSTLIGSRAAWSKGYCCAASTCNLGKQPAHS